MKTAKDRAKRIKLIVASLFLAGILTGLFFTGNNLLYAFNDDTIITTIPIGINGDNVKAVLEKDGTLTLSGEGEIEDYTAGTNPFKDYRSQISQIVIEDGVTSIGNYLFYNCNKLNDTLEIPSTVVRIGDYAFNGVDERSASHFTKIINRFTTADITVEVEKEIPVTESDAPQEDLSETSEEDSKAESQDKTTDAPTKAEQTLELPAEQEEQQSRKIEKVMEIKTISEQQMGVEVFSSTTFGGYQCEDGNVSFINTMTRAKYRKAQRFISVKLDDTLTRNLPVFDGAITAPEEPETGLTNPSADDALHESVFTGWYYQNKEVNVNGLITIDSSTEQILLSSKWETHSTIEPEVRQMIEEKKTVYTIFNKIIDSEILDVEGYTIAYQWQMKTADGEWQDIEGETKQQLERESSEEDTTSLFRATISITKESKMRTVAKPTIFTTNEVMGINAEKPITIHYDAGLGSGDGPTNMSISENIPYKPEENSFNAPISADNLMFIGWKITTTNTIVRKDNGNIVNTNDIVQSSDLLSIKLDGVDFGSIILTAQWGQGTIVYLDSSLSVSGDGTTPEKAVRSLNEAYNKLPSEGSMNTNKIILAHDYEITSTTTLPAKKATITAISFDQSDSPVLWIDNSNLMVTIGEDTKFENIKISGPTFWNGNIERPEGIYADFHTLVMGDNIINHLGKLQLFGGSRTANKSGNSDIKIYSGLYRYINGAGYNTNSSGDTNVTVFGGSGTIYGGIHVGGTLTGNTHITAYGGSYSIFGGNRYGKVTGDTNIKVYGGKHSVFGASHAGNGYVKNVNIEIYDIFGTTQIGEFCGGVYDGNSSSGYYPVDNIINITIKGGIFNSIYGGGLNDWSNGSNPVVRNGVNLTVENAEIKNDVYLGGKYGAISGNSTLKIMNSQIHGSVYGGGLGGKNPSNYNVSSNVNGNIIMMIDSLTLIENNVYGSGNNMSTVSGTVTIDFYGKARNLYGAGNGASTTLNKDSTITFYENASISENIYGGGEEGKMTGTSTINILGGSIGSQETEDSGNIYGGGNKIGVSSSAINVKNTPSIIGNIYGGSNSKGTTPTSTINIGGTVKNNVYAGGKGADTSVTNGILNINNSASISGNAFGGSEQGVVTNSTVILNGGYVKNVFGGSDRASITGEVKVTSLADSNVGNIYAGCNSSGSVPNPVLNLAGKADNVYGGGNATPNDVADVTGKTTITVASNSDNKIDNVYGGSNSSGLVNSPIIKINGHVGNVYGGGYGEQTITNTPTVTIENANVDNVYGGGNQGIVHDTNVIVTTDSNITNAFAGGNKAGVDGTIKIQATSTANITNLYGGSNSKGTVNNPIIQVNGSSSEKPTIANVYGGGYGVDTITKTPTVNIDGYVTLENVYGGGNLGQTSDSSLNIGKSGEAADTGTAQKVFAGGNKAGVTGKSTVIVNTPVNITNLYGGSNSSGDVEDVDLTINGTVETVFGGGLGDGTKTYTPIINVNNGAKIKNLYGGGDEGRTFTSSHITLSSGSVVSENIYGAGNQVGIEDKQNAGIGAKPESDSYIVILYGAKVEGNVYGGSNQRGTVKGTANITVDGTITGDIFGGGKGTDTQVFNSHIAMSDAASAKSVYGGSENGSIEESTLMQLQGSQISESVYGAGYGKTSDVKHDVHIIIADAVIAGNVFGGGSEGTVGGNTHVDIISGTIGTTLNDTTGNIFGGSDSAIVSGNTKVHIGKFALEGNSIVPTKKEIKITQSIFGGGNKSASGTSFDASNPYVLGDAEVNVDTDTYTMFSIKKSLFGDGNKCVVAGNRTFLLKNYNAELVSIQRADSLTIETSDIEIIGTTDSANLVATSQYSLNRIGNLILKGGSIVKMQTPANLLLGIESQDSDGKLTTASNAVSTGNTLFMQQGEALELRTNEDVSRPGYGAVKGFARLGRYDKDNANLEKGIYILGGAGVDDDSGFYYANDTDADQEITKDAKITPAHDETGTVWRNWKVANALVTRTETMTMSDKPTGGKTVQLEGGSADGSIYRLDTDSLKIKTQNGTSENFSIKEAGQMTSSDDKNTTLGISISTGQVGWLEQRKVGYIVGSSNGTGNKIIVDETNKGEMRSINGGAANPVVQVDLSNLDGIDKTDAKEPLRVSFTIIMVKLQPDGSEIETGKMNVILNIRREENKNYTDTALQSSKNYDRAGQSYTYNSTDQKVGVTVSKGSSLTLQYAQQGQLNAVPSNHTLTFSQALPANTTILMVDKKGTYDEYYSYSVPSGGTNSVKLSDFIKNETTNEKYQPVAAIDKKESFIFVLDFANADTYTSTKNVVTLDAKDYSNNSVYKSAMTTIFAVEGEKKNYSLSSEKAAGTLTLTPDYPMNTTFLIDLQTAVTNANAGIDTTGAGRQMGVKVKLYNEDLKRYIDIPPTWKIISNGVRYGTSGDSLTVVLADQMTEATSNIYVSMDNLSNVPSGNYRFDIELVSGGLANYPGDTTTTAASSVQYKFKLKDYRYSISVEMLTPDEPVFTKDTEERTINALITKVAQGGADTSEVTIEQVASKKNTTTKKYEDMNLSDVFTGNLDTALGWKINKQTYTLKEGLATGTYRITYTIKAKVEVDGKTVIKDVGTETLNFIVTDD